MTTPRLSICIPTYNRGETLEVLLQSIFNDTGKNDVEVIVSDNASTDSTSALMAALQGKGMKISYHRNDSNIGIDRNFLRAVELAKGDYAVLVGSDDEFPPGAISQILLLLESEPDLLFYNRIECDSEMRRIGESAYIPSVKSASNYDLVSDRAVADYINSCVSIAGCGSFISSSVFKRDRWAAAVLPENLKGLLYPHVAKFMTIVSKGAAVLYAPEHLVKCRLANDSFSSMSACERIDLDLNGMDAIASDRFRDMPLAMEALKRLSVREHTDLALSRFSGFLSIRVRSNNADWERLVRRFSELGEPGQAFLKLNAMFPSWIMSGHILPALFQSARRAFIETRTWARAAVR